MKTLLSICVLMSVTLVPAAMRQGAAPPPSMPTRLSPVVQSCVSCHGVNGEGKPDAGFPRLAGQAAYYLEKQLDDYASRRRVDATMSPIASGLSTELRKVVAGYFARVDATKAARTNAFTASWAERGRVIAVSGDPQRGVQACINCHGPGGVGQPPNVPYLSGLHDGYIRSALAAWRNGTRNNDEAQQMTVVAKAMSADDIAAVARYFAGGMPPAPAPNVAQAGRPQLVPAAMTKTITIGTFAQDHPGAEGRAARGSGEEGLGQSGRGGMRDAGAGGSSTSREGSESRSPAPGGNAQADAANGRALVVSGAYGCTACHVIPGIRAPRGIVGPQLGGLAQRPFIAGQLPNTIDVLAAFLQDPPSLVPATGMPNVGLSRAHARDIAAYLYTLPATDAR